jgi:hypothetical protein
MHSVLFVLAFFQVDASPSIPKRYSVADLQVHSARRNTVGGPASTDPYTTCEFFRIQPFLQVASDLQAMPEHKRVATLFEWASVESLSEPTKLLCYMLLEKSDGSQLRPPPQGGALPVLRGSDSDFPDMPLLFFKGVPFYIVVGYQAAGRPVPAREYLQHALSVGKWRRTKYHTVDEKKLKEIAEQFVDQHRTQARFPRSFRAFIMSQVGPPQPPSQERVETGNQSGGGE